MDCGNRDTIASNRVDCVLTSLGDPHVLAACDTLGGRESAAEETAGALDGVVVLGLVKGESVDGEKVDIVNDSLVRCVDPRSPGINVGDLDLSKSSACELAASSLDELHDLLRAVTNTRLVLDTGLRHTVEILATDRDTDDEISQLRSVLLDRSLEGVQLVVDVVGARRPDTEKQLRVRRDSGGESGDRLWVLLGTSLDVGVQADGGEVARRALKILGCLELLLKVGLSLRLASIVSGSSVEAKDQVILRNRAANSGRRDGKKSRKAHGC
jgi:hypothetical protein